MEKTPFFIGNLAMLNNQMVVSLNPLLFDSHVQSTGWSVIIGSVKQIWKNEGHPFSHTSIHIHTYYIYIHIFTFIISCWSYYVISYHNFSICPHFFQSYIHYIIDIYIYNINHHCSTIYIYPCLRYTRPIQLNEPTQSN